MISQLFIFTLLGVIFSECVFLGVFGCGLLMLSVSVSVCVCVWLDSVKEILEQIGEGSSFKQIIQNLDSTSTFFRLTYSVLKSQTLM